MKKLSEDIRDEIAYWLYKVKHWWRFRK